MDQLVLLEDQVKQDLQDPRVSVVRLEQEDSLDLRAALDPLVKQGLQGSLVVQDLGVRMVSEDSPVLLGNLGPLGSRENVDYQDNQVVFLI